MKFDYCIGNPPYQEEKPQNGRPDPLYNKFMDEAYKVANCIELITPARFLFNAGQTPKVWNRKMLNDSHFKVLKYESDASKLFTTTEIKGGVAITLYDGRRDFGKIGVFTEFEELNGILEKVNSRKNTKSITDICVGAVPYAYTDVLKEEHPEWVELAGDSFDLRTNAFEKLYGKVFFENKTNDSDAAIMGILNKKRVTLYARLDYIMTPINFEKYKIIMSKAQGGDKFGESFSTIMIGGVHTGHTQSFISIGSFETESEALNLKKYVSTKFARCLLSILKKTPDITPYKWEYVPLQDFSDNSDIDWSKSIHEIDLQLYKKYALTKEEIEFIESHVKEMD